MLELTAYTFDIEQLGMNPMDVVCPQFIGVADFGRDVFAVQYSFGVSMDVMCSQFIDQRSWTWCVHSSNILEILVEGCFLMRQLQDWVA